MQFSCQVTNHCHVMLETVEPNLSQGMRHLNDVYTQYGNRTHGQVVMCFIDFVRAGVDQPLLWDKLRGQIYLGDDAFLEKMSPLAPSPCVPLLTHSACTTPL
jgi:hypothetical protein